MPASPTHDAGDLAGLVIIIHQFFQTKNKYTMVEMGQHILLSHFDHQSLLHGWLYLIEYA